MASCRIVPAGPQEVVRRLPPPVRRLRLERREALAPAPRRPAQAESWLLLAGARAALGDAASGAALARRAAWLDPGRPGLAEAVERLTAPDAGDAGSPP
jgi:hypothetical protein